MKNAAIAFGLIIALIVLWFPFSKYMAGKAYAQGYADGVANLGRSDGYSSGFWSGSYKRGMADATFQRNPAP